MEMLNDLNLPGLPRIYIGAGAISRLPEVVRTYGRRALVMIGGQSLVRSGRWNGLSGKMNQADLRYEVVSVREEPTKELIDAIAGKYRKTSLDVVVAIGGGSVIDCAKAVSAMLTEEGSVKDYLEGVGIKKPSGAKVPFIAVPTTAGTGSEATKNAVVCDRNEGYKKSLRHDAYIPDIAIVDPELTLATPPSITIACGLDAVSQLIESYTSTRADIAVDSVVLKALSFAFHSLKPLAFEQSNDIRLRTKMSYAAMVSGIALNRSGLGAVHGLAGPLGGLCPAPHGLACGKLLFPTMTFVVKKIIDEQNTAAQKRFADIGRLMSGVTDCDDTFSCRLFLDMLFKWTQSLKLPQLSHFGMTAAIMNQTISIADSKNSPAILSEKEFKVILETVR